MKFFITRTSGLVHTQDLVVVRAGEGWLDVKPAVIILDGMIIVM